MGADTTSTQLIFFIAATVVATAATGVFGSVIANLTQEVQEKGDAMQASISTDVEVINDPENVPTNPSRFYVKNVGTTNLDENLTTLLVDGQFVEYTATRLGGADRWRPGDVVEFSVTNAEWTPAVGDHTLRVITPSGAWDDLRFRIES